MQHFTKFINQCNDTKSIGLKKILNWINHYSELHEIDNQCQKFKTHSLKIKTSEPNMGIIEMTIWGPSGKESMQ